MKTEDYAALAWSGCSCFELRKLSRTVTRLYDQHMAVTGMTATQYALLMHVRHQALPITQLATQFGAERTTLTRNLKPLLEQGWVVLATGEDTRQRIVSISEAGRTQLRAARAVWRRAQQALEQALGATAVQALHAQIEHAHARLLPLLAAG
jgi:DNA-binding MarR family transcriptional regulator